PGGDEAGDVGHERRRRPPADEPHPPHVRLGEPAAGELGPHDGRHVPPAERRMDERDRRRLGRPAFGHLPAQDVEHLAPDQHPVPDHPVGGRRQPRGDRREGGGRRRRDDGRDRPALQRRQLREPGPGGVDGPPPEAVEHEEDDGAGSGHRGRQPRRRLPPEQRRDEPGYGGTAVVGPDLLRGHVHVLEGNRRSRLSSRSGRPPVNRRATMADVKVSTRGDYAARALLSMALHGYDRPTSVKEIAERTGLPQPYLEQILLAVKGAGLARSKRGVGGGYVLAGPPEEITLADIVAAADGPITTYFDSHDHREGHCALQDVWVKVSEEMRSILEGFTLADLVERARIGHDLSDLTS